MPMSDSGIRHQRTLFNQTSVPRHYHKAWQVSRARPESSASCQDFLPSYQTITQRQSNNFIQELLQLPKFYRKIQLQTIYKSHFYHGNIYSNSESNLNLIPWSRFKSFQDTIRAIRPQWPHIGGRTLGCRGLQLPRLRCHDPIIFNCRPRADNNKYLNASMLP